MARYLAAEFRERTGLKLRIEQGGTGEMLMRLRTETASGRGESCDVLWGGGAESLWANADLFEPYVSPEAAAIPGERKAADGSWTGFTVLPMVLVYNRRLLAPERAPGSWASLLEPRFRGRVAYADPSASGSAYTILRTATLALSRGRSADEALGLFAEFIGGRLLPESTQVVPSVASGDCLVGLSFENAVTEALSTDQDLRIVYPTDGTSAVPDGVALVEGAPHPAEARRFIDFVLSSDAAKIVVGRFGRRSARLDAPSPKGLAPLSSLSILPYDISAAAAAKASLVEAFRSRSAR
jgi:iron(III) transport system substrate-binding protein